VNKLNCLIAVLEVAIAKVSQNGSVPTDRAERMQKIRANLENTLAICRRARTTLEGKTFGGQEARVVQLPALRPSRPGQMTYRDYVEFTTVEEYRKFKRLPPIAADELVSLDLEKLIRDLQV
jgi:hypothetical protein